MFDKIIKTTVKVATQPLRDGLDIIEGLSEGKIREKAIARLGAEVVSTMTLAEIIEYLQDD